MRIRQPTSEEFAGIEDIVPPQHSTMDIFECYRRAVGSVTREGGDQ